MTMRFPNEHEMTDMFHTHAELILGCEPRDDACEYQVALLCAMAGLVVQGRIPADVAAVMADPHDYAHIIQVGFGAADGEEFPALAAHMAERLAG